MERGRGLNQKELDLEKGLGASLEEVKKQADVISAKWANLPKTDKPTLLMLGGFQGSGKTTVLNILSPKLNLIVISPDEIRHNLFEQNYFFSENFVRLVNATKFELIKRALDLGVSFSIDQSLTPDRVKLTKEAASSYSSYNIKSVFLDSPKELLKTRVTERPKVEGQYRGTVDELEASINIYRETYGEPSEKDYDLFIESTQKSEAIANLIEKELDK